MEQTDIQALDRCTVYRVTVDRAGCLRSFEAIVTYESEAQSDSRWRFLHLTDNSGGWWCSVLTAEPLESFPSAMMGLAYSDHALRRIYDWYSNPLLRLAHVGSCMAEVKS